jgi:Cu-processing system permease protein
MYIGIVIPLISGFVAGIGIPLLYSGIQSRADIIPLSILLGTGIVLTMIFLAMAFLISLGTEDRAKGLGYAILIWLFFNVIYDGLILILIYLYSEYPLEHATIVMSLLNPIDLGRLLILMQFDIAAMLGYTGAVFQKFFGSLYGVLISGSMMLIWITVPLYSGLRIFLRKDF